MQARILTGLTALYCGIFAGFLPSQPGATQQEQGVQTKAAGSARALLTLKLKDRLLRDVVQTIRRKVGVNIVMDEDIDETVTIDLEDVEWRVALDMVAEKAGCVVVTVAKNLLKVEKPPRVFFAFTNAPIQEVIDTIAKISGANIVVAPARTRRFPWASRRRCVPNRGRLRGRFGASAAWVFPGVARCEAHATRCLSVRPCTHNSHIP